MSSGGQCELGGGNKGVSVVVVQLAGLAAERWGLWWRAEETM